MWWMYLCLLYVGCLEGAYVGVAPGSIIERSNEVWIANDFIYVSVEMTCVLDAADELRSYESKLGDVKRTLWDNSKRKFEFP